MLNANKELVALTAAILKAADVIISQMANAPPESDTYIVQKSQDLVNEVERQMKP